MYMPTNQEPEIRYIFAQTEMAARTRAFEWETTSLGPITLWPAQLLTMVNQILDSSFPMFIWWGAEKIQFYNDAYLKILGTDEVSKHPRALGQRGEDCWPEIWEVINPLIEQVLITTAPVYLEDQLIPIFRKGILDEVYWTFSYNVIRDASGSSCGVLVVCSETTAKVNFQKEIAEGYHVQQELNSELKAANEELSFTQQDLQDFNRQLEQRVQERTQALSESEFRFRSLIENSPAAMLVLRGEDLIVETINDAMLHIIGKSAAIVGQPLLDALPEVKGQPVEKIIKTVYLTGQPFTSTSLKVDLERNNQLQPCYFNLSYRPIFINGRVTGIVEAAVEVTTEVEAKLKIEMLNADLAAINLVQAQSNVELAEVNTQLLQIQETLELTVSQLKESNGRFQNLIRDATVGIIVLIGDEMRVKIVNQSYADFIGSSVDELVTQPLYNNLPQLKNTLNPIYQQIKHNGEAINQYDVPYKLSRGDEQVAGYMNVIYQPYREADGQFRGLIILCQDTTEQVNARLRVQKADEMTNLAITAARLGSWHLDPESKSLIYNDTLAELYGYQGTDKMTFQQVLEQISDEYRVMVIEEINKAISYGGHYDVTFTQKRFDNAELIWLRSLGKISYDKNGNPSLFSGFVMDVTEQQKDEQRKNDFIGMVSHELKTPITSLLAYLQLLQNKSIKNDDQFAVAALGNCLRQIKKMTTMINGFLNVSRLDAGKIQIDKQRFDMAELMREIEEESVGAVSSHAILFAPVEETWIVADRNKIGQVVDNLVSNAVKYSYPNSAIKISCVHKDQQIQVSVTDEGPGIAPENLDKIFERYFRTETASDSLVAGFGIGLYLCSEIIEHHGGEIWVESEQGSGSTFYFTLPV
jgi:two-component system sensor histidine kinase VicK